MKLSTYYLLLFSVIFAPAMLSQTNDKPVSKQEALPHSIPQTMFHINIDGKLDEHAWNDALIINLPYETWPNENISAPVPTTALLLYTQSHLYVGFHAYDPEPSDIRAHYIDRDHIWDEDYVVIYLDTFNDERRAYAFRSNPLGVQADDIQTNSDEAISWDAIYETAGQISDSGYTVEMAIPFNQIFDDFMG